MNGRWVVVDGYSVLYAWPGLRKKAGRSLEKQRNALIALLRQYADQTGQRVTVVFDGYGAKHKPSPAEPVSGVEVVFSESGKTADDSIERLVAQAAQPQQMVVVTSDNVERQTVEGLGAMSLSAESFEMECKAVLKELAAQVRAYGRRRRLGSLGEQF